MATHFFIGVGTCASRSFTPQPADQVLGNAIFPLERVLARVETGKWVSPPAVICWPTGESRKNGIFATVHRIGATARATEMFHFNPFARAFVGSRVGQSAVFGERGLDGTATGGPVADLTEGVLPW